MRRGIIPALFVCAFLLAGCDDGGRVDPLAQLQRANTELQRQVESQARVIWVMGLALVVLGGGLAVTLGALWKRGASSTTPAPH